MQENDRISPSVNPPVKSVYVIPRQMLGTSLKVSNERHLPPSPYTSNTTSSSLHPMPQSFTSIHEYGEVQYGDPRQSPCKTSSVSCPICGKQFSRDKYLDMHVGLHQLQDSSPAAYKPFISVDSGRKISSTVSHSNVGSLENSIETSGGIAAGGGQIRKAVQDSVGVASVTSLKQSTVTSRVTSSTIASFVPTSTLDSAQKLPFSKVVILQDDTSPVRSNSQWSCQICHKIFSQNSSFRNHMRTHSSDRPYVCEVCSIGFKERYHLKKHVLFKHSNEMKEECKICGKRFKDSTAIRAHERIHSDVRPYSCTTCGKSFKTSECLWHHTNRSKKCGLSSTKPPAKPQLTSTNRNPEPIKSEPVVTKPPTSNVISAEKLLELNKIQLGMAQGLFIPFLNQPGLTNNAGIDYSKISPLLLANAINLLSSSLALQKVQQENMNNIDILQRAASESKVVQESNKAEIRTVNPKRSTTTEATQHEASPPKIYQSLDPALYKPETEYSSSSSPIKSNALALAEALLSSCSSYVTKVINGADGTLSGNATESRTGQLSHDDSGSSNCPVYIIKSHEDERSRHSIQSTNSGSPTSRIFPELKGNSLLESPSETEKLIVYDENGIKSNNIMKLAIINDPSLASNARSPCENPFEISPGVDSVPRRDGLSLLASCAIDMPESELVLRGSRALRFTERHEVKVEQEVELPDYELTAMTSPVQSSLASSPYYEKDTGAECGDDEDHMFFPSPEIKSPKADKSFLKDAAMLVQKSSRAREVVGYNQKFVCNRCGKHFSSLASFEKHAIAHSESRPYRCEICDVGFKLKVHLRKHDLYRHSNVYPCKCKECGKPFKDTSALRLHERTHSTSRPFVCQKCFKTFKTRENLWGHQNRGPCSSKSTTSAVEGFESGSGIQIMDHNGNMTESGLLDDGRVYLFDQDCVEEHVIETEMEMEEIHQHDEDVDVKDENAAVLSSNKQENSGINEAKGQIPVGNFSNLFQTPSISGLNLRQDGGAERVDGSGSLGGLQLPPLCYYTPYLTRFGNIVYFAPIGGETVMLFGNSNLNQYLGSNVPKPNTSSLSGIDQLLNASQVSSPNPISGTTFLSPFQGMKDITDLGALQKLAVESSLPLGGQMKFISERSAALGSAANLSGELAAGGVWSSSTSTSEVRFNLYSDSTSTLYLPAAASTMSVSASGEHGGVSAAAHQPGSRVPTAVVNPIKRSQGSASDGGAGASKLNLPPFESLVPTTFRQPTTSQ